MGAHNFAAMLQTYRRALRDHDKAFRLLAYMAHVSRDDDPEPWFGMGHAALAYHALGRDLDEHGEASQADLRAVRRGITTLLDIGAITVIRPANGRRSEHKTVCYRLHLHAPAKADDDRTDGEPQASNPPDDRRTLSGPTVGRSVVHRRTLSGSPQDAQRPPKEKEENREEKKREHHHAGDDGSPSRDEADTGAPGGMEEARALLERVRQRCAPELRVLPSYVTAVAEQLAAGHSAADIERALAEARSYRSPAAGVVEQVRALPDLLASRPRRQPVPPWCGQCDPAGQDSPAARLVTGADGGVLPCPRCHPRGATSSSRGDRPSPADQRQDAPASEDTRRQAMAQILATLGKRLPG